MTARTNSHPASSGPASAALAPTNQALWPRPGASGQPLLTDATAGQVVRAYLRDRGARLTALEPALRADEPDAVHQMRTTTRRLRAALQAFRRVIPRADSARLAGELRWLGGVLGEARDGEVLATHILDQIGDVPAEQVVGPVRARVRGHFAPARAATRAEVLATLSSARYLALLGELERLAATPPAGPDAGRLARDVLPAAVRHSFRRAERRMRRAYRTPPGPRRDVALHEARKAVKRARYAAEAVTPVAGKPARRFARRLKRVQSALGAHQDAVIAGHVVRQLGMSAHLAGENAFTYGLLHERDTRARARSQAQARQAWHRAARHRHRRWTH